MGIVILPFLLGVLIIGIIALIELIKFFKLKSIEIIDLFFGLLISMILFSLISLVYIIERKAWAFSPVFRIPFLMIFVPFGIYIFFNKNENTNVAYFSKICLISIVFTVILGIIFNDIFFNFIDFLGIKKHY